MDVLKLPISRNLTLLLTKLFTGKNPVPFCNTLAYRKGNKSGAKPLKLKEISTSRNFPGKTKQPKQLSSLRSSTLEKLEVKTKFV